MELLERRRNLLLENQVSGPVIPPNGVYILGTDNKFYKRDEWMQSNNNAVGVAIVTNNCKFVIGPDDANYRKRRWGDPDITISNIATTEDANQAKLDYKGNDNTTKIINQDGSSNNAEYDCRNYTFKNGKKGYLGALGEWQAAYDNKAAVAACMSKIGGWPINTGDYYWSSTQYSMSAAWLISWSDGSTDGDIKIAGHYVRAFAAL